MGVHADDEGQPECLYCGSHTNLVKDLLGFYLCEWHYWGDVVGRALGDERMLSEPWEKK